MDRNTNRNTGRRSPENRYSGRFGSSGDAGARRPTGSYRSRPAGDYRSRQGYGDRRDHPARPSMRDSGDSYTRRPDPKTPQPSPAQPKKPRKKGGIWIWIAAALLVVLLAALVIVLLLDGDSGSLHMLPTIEKI